MFTQSTYFLFFSKIVLTSELRDAILCLQGQQIEANQVTLRGEDMETEKLEIMLERWREEEMRERRRNDLCSFAVNLLVALAALIVAIRV